MKPREIVEEYGFHVKLVHRVPTKMHGSGRQFTCSIFKRLPDAFRERAIGMQHVKSVDIGGVPCDPLFRDAFEGCTKGGFDIVSAFAESCVGDFFRANDSRPRKDISYKKHM